MHQFWHNTNNELLSKYFLSDKTNQSPCEKVLGNSQGVQKMAQFWDNAQNYLLLLSAVQLQNFIVENRPSIEEIDAYKKAQADIGLFIATCHLEIEQKKALQKTE